MTTPSYTPGAVTVFVPLDLEDMPAIPTQYGRKGLIPQHAVVTFDIEGDTPVYHRIQLSGVVPLKSGSPSRNPQSDDYWAGTRNPVPEPVQAVIEHARQYLLATLRGVTK